MYHLDDIKEIARVIHFKDRTERETFGAIYNRCLKLYFNLQNARFAFIDDLEQSFTRHHKEKHFNLQDYYDAYYEFNKCYCQLSQFAFNASLEEV